MNRHTQILFNNTLKKSFHSDKCAGMNPQFISYNTGLRCIEKIQGEDREEKNLFFYHSDHIGSSSFVTDRTGIASQHLQYLPFGELFVEQQTLTNYSTPYKFSGKEKDEETSYSYFGARYYMSDVSIWLSVDPLAEKYPSMSPFMYCAGNPIMLIDPDGRDIDPTEEAWSVMNESFKATLGENNPFSYNENTGKVDYDKNKIQGDVKPVQQEVIDHYKSLVEDHNYQVNVSVVENDEQFMDENGNKTSLLANNANGLAVQSKDGKTTDVYLSRKPYYKDENDKLRVYPQRTDMRSIISIHEIGGHAYYFQQNDSNNNYKTSDFESKVRSIFEGSHIKNYIKDQPLLRHEKN